MSKLNVASMVILLLLVTLQSGNIVAESTSYYAASYDPAAQTITIYVSEDTSFTPIGTVNAGFAEASPFRLVRISRVALSPDGQHVALVGQDTTITTDSPVYQLRIYDLATQQLTTQQPIPLPSDYAIPSWSPDGQSLLVEPTFAYYGSIPITENFIYSLSDDAISYPLKTNDQAKRLFWTPNNLLFGTDSSRESVMTVLPSTVSVTDSADLEANVDVKLPNQNFCQFAWSPYNSRWYVSVGCAGDGSGIESIYSFGNANDLRLEINLKDYVEDYPGSAQVRDIQVTPNGVYVLTPWPSRVIQIGFDGTIVPFSQGDGLGVAYLRISPNGRLVALYGREAGLVINTLTTGERLLNSTMSGLICHMQWLDDTRLTFSTFDSGQCIYDNFGLPTGIRVWDTTSNSFTLPLGESSWILPMPYSEQASP